MNPIIQILNESNISKEKTEELFQALTENPMMAIAMIQTMGIAPEKLQQIMGLVMSNPNLIKEAVEEYLPKNFDGPVMTISLLRTNSSYHVSGGGRESK